jgi:hypothetical protein
VGGILQQAEVFHIIITVVISVLLRTTQQAKLACNVELCLTHALHHKQHLMHATCCNSLHCLPTSAPCPAALQIRLLLGMLCASPWRYYPLTLQFLSQQHSTLPKGE